MRPSQEHAVSLPLPPLRYREFDKSQARDSTLRRICASGLRYLYSLTWRALRSGALSPAAHPDRRSALLVEPDVFHAPAVVDAVCHDVQVLDPGPPAAIADWEEQHWAHRRFGQLFFDFPNELLPLLRVRFHRLPVDHLVEFRIADTGIIPQRAGIEVFVEHHVRVIDSGLDRHGTDRKVLAINLWIPLRRIDDVEFGVDPDLLELRIQQYGRVPPRGDIARGDFGAQRIVRSVAQLFHDFTGLCAVFLHIGAVARQRSQLILRHAPDAARRRQHQAADILLAAIDDLRERVAV